MGIIAREAAAEKRSGEDSLSNNHRNQKQKDRRFLPIPAPALLEGAYREWDDLPPSVSIAGFPAETIALAGYKFSISGCASPVTIPRRQIIIAVRNIAGQIVGLHNSKNEWYTARAIHFANVVRAKYTGEIETYSTTIEADVEAYRRNVTCAALNGLTADDLKLSVAHLSVKVDWRVAA